MPEGVGYASSNVIAGAGLELNYVGDHCYAYSGLQSISSSSQTLLSFQTGNNTIEAEIYCTGPLKFSDPASGDKTNFQISINGVAMHILGSRAANSAYTNPFPNTIKVILPPYTNVLIESDSSTTDATQFSAASLTGKVY